jgi:spermidine synthase
LFPQYFKQAGEERVAVAAADVPAETKLREQEFKLAGRGEPYTSPTTGAWSRPGAKQGPFTVKLGDGSRVTYSWYRFVDQPSFQQYDWSEEKKAALPRSAGDTRSGPARHTAKGLGGGLRPHCNTPVDTMKPNLKLAETTTPDGARLVLYEHDGAYCIRLNGQDLMHSSVTASELRLGELAAETLSGQPESLALLGGMGLGFTLKSLLAKGGPGTKVQVAELIPQIIDWNRNLLAHLNGTLLDDPRVEVLLRDVWTVIAGAEPARYDALVLDIDNGPTAMVQKLNARLYSSKGLERIAAVLKPHGRALFWSARPDPAFAKRLARAGFEVRVVAAPLYAAAKRCAVSIYVAEKQTPAAPSLSPATGTASNTSGSSTSSSPLVWPPPQRRPE